MVINKIKAKKKSIRTTSLYRHNDIAGGIEYDGLL